MLTKEVYVNLEEVNIIFHPLANLDFLAKKKYSQKKKYSKKILAI